MIAFDRRHEVADSPQARLPRYVIIFKFYPMGLQVGCNNRVSVIGGMLQSDRLGARL